VDTSGVPAHLREGLLRYFSDGILPGSFLQAVLCNNLIEAVRRADPISFHALPSLFEFLVAYAPADSWGAREKVLGWTTTPARLEIP
jgi:hypothetical protein